MRDIEAMFHQVKVLKVDPDSLRFLWCTNPSLPIEEYIMRARIFGKTDSNCCTNWALKSTPLGNKTEHSTRVIEVTLGHLFFNWDLLNARLKSHYAAWSYKKKKHKKVRAHRKSEICLERTYI